MDELKGTMGTGRKVNGHVRHGSIERFTTTVTQTITADYCCIAAATIVTSPSSSRDDSVITNGFLSKPEKLLSNGLLHKHEVAYPEIIASSGDASLVAVKAQLREEEEVFHEDGLPPAEPVDLGPAEAVDDEEFEDCALYVDIITIIGYIYLHIFGYLRDFLRKLKLERSLTPQEKNNEGFVPLYNDWENFYKRNVYVRARDVVDKPICSVPGPVISVMERSTPNYGWTFKFTGRKVPCINMASYNYLGFAQPTGVCADASVDCLERLGVSNVSSRNDVGTQTIHVELEDLVARFVGTEAALTFGMGFATNSANIPALVDKRCAILSDAFNHASIVTGARLSGATVKVFKHNDMKDLEAKLKELILTGHPRTRRPFKKILVIVEGIYSMEGSICKLPEIIALKKKYKAYLYLDEAHSIGALGPHGRGVVDYFGLDARDVDVMMGTFTKSFGSSGGYIAGSKAMVNYLRHSSSAMIYSAAMPPPIAQQIITSMKVIMGEDGTDEGARRIQQLADNTRYLRTELRRLGFIVYGNKDSPVVPVLTFNFGRGIAFARLLMQRGVAIVVVGFPVTPVRLCRARLCVSAFHTREMLETVVKEIDYLGDLCRLKYSRKHGPNSKKKYAVPRLKLQGDRH